MAARIVQLYLAFFLCSCALASSLKLNSRHEKTTRGSSSKSMVQSRSALESNPDRDTFLKSSRRYALAQSVGCQGLSCKSSLTTRRLPLCGKLYDTDTDTVPLLALCVDCLEMSHIAQEGR